jgi:hypothetical protein
MADVQILRTAATGHLDFTVPGSQEIIVKAIKASYDGGGAAGSFIPAVQVISPAGEDAGTYTAVSELAAGDSADVSFGPFLVGLGDAIRFDVDNRGGTLRVTTTGQDGVTGDGMRFVTEGGGGYDVVSSGSMTLVSQSGAQTIWNQDAASTQTIQSDGPLALTSGSNKLLGIAAQAGRRNQHYDHRHRDADLPERRRLRLGQQSRRRRRERLRVPPKPMTTSWSATAPP